MKRWFVIDFEKKDNTKGKTLIMAKNYLYALGKFKKQFKNGERVTLLCERKFR